MYNHICICKNASLTIKDNISAYRNVTITVRPHATLIVDGGIINRICVKAEKQSNVIIKRDGEILSPIGCRFHMPTGVNLHVSSGKIE